MYLKSTIMPNDSGSTFEKLVPDVGFKNSLDGETMAYSLVFLKRVVASAVEVTIVTLLKLK